MLNDLTSFEFPIRLDAWVFHCSIGQSLPDENSVLTPSTVIRTKMNTSFGFDLFLFPKKSRLKFFCMWRNFKWVKLDQPTMQNKMFILWTAWWTGVSAVWGASQNWKCRDAPFYAFDVVFLCFCLVCQKTKKPVKSSILWGFGFFWNLFSGEWGTFRIYFYFTDIECFMNLI